PSASFALVVDGLSVSFDGSGSSAGGVPIESYAWAFGDGQSGTGVSVEHTYGEAGSYTVELTVTDENGLSDTATETVDVEPAEPNVRPTARFVQTIDRLEVSFDASTSSD